jgi:hypothetical protein
MKLVIQIRDGQPFEHPIMADNFVQAFPHLNIDSLPSNFAKFERIEKPNKMGPYQIEEEKYEWVDGIVKDVWYTREMTPEEKSATRAMYEERLQERVVLHKESAAYVRNLQTTDAGKQVYTDYIARIDAFTWDDPALVKLEPIPKVDADGNVVTNSSSGSAPNVIG